MGIFQHEIIEPIQKIRKQVQTELQHESPVHYWDELPLCLLARFKKSHWLKLHRSLGEGAELSLMQIYRSNVHCSCNAVFVLQFSSEFSRVFQSISQAPGHISHMQARVHQQDEFFDLVDLLLRHLPPSPSLLGLEWIFLCSPCVSQGDSQEYRSWNFSYVIMVKFYPIFFS